MACRMRSHTTNRSASRRWSILSRTRVALLSAREPVALKHLGGRAIKARIGDHWCCSPNGLGAVPQKNPCDACGNMVNV